MMKTTSVMLTLTAFCLTFTVTPSHGQDGEPLTIKSIMKDAFKGPLVKKVGKGDATAEEKQQLLDYSKAMQGLMPPKGDAESWKDKTAAMVEAAQAAVDGKEDASSLLMKATNCAACHTPHKPS